MNIPQNLKYTQKHEWVLVKGSSATVGITDYAQGALGDITFVELPKTGKVVKQFEELSVVESVKAANDIFSPLSGKISEVNSALENSPELLNKDPYGEGWICKLEDINTQEIDNLLSKEKYEKFVQGLSKKD